MKKFILLLAVTHFGIGMARPAEFPMYNFNNGFIFVERGITFSVYPDGEFDFYMDNQIAVNAQFQVGSVGFTFNSGYDYGPFVQYDDFGAVIQIENVPIYYDYYGRVSRIGNTGIRYRNNRLYRIGGMNIFYNPAGFYAYHTGFINVYNRNYIFNPFHNYFVRPIAGFCLVNRNPYRRTYRPLRYRFYQPYRNNHRRAYAQVGRVHKHSVREDRDRLYLNNTRGNSRSTASALPSVRSNWEHTGSVRTNSIGNQNRVVRNNSGNRPGESVTGRRSSPRTETPSRNSQVRSYENARSSSGMRQRDASVPSVQRNSTPRYQSRSSSSARPQRSASGNRSAIQKSNNRRSNITPRATTEQRRSSGNSGGNSRRSGNN
ncbi:hypothetical protein N9L94_04240 [Robiginitalea sp.]|nr:hypothetical protein [Robiginitalea sp.]